jgi:serine/threonine protein kinase
MTARWCNKQQSHELAVETRLYGTVPSTADLDVTTLAHDGATLGVGSHGAVTAVSWEAQGTIMQGALKTEPTQPRDLGAARVAMLTQVAQALCSVSNGATGDIGAGNLMAVYKVVRHQGHTYWLTERCVGTSLDQAATFTEADAWLMLRDIAAALEVMHKNHLLHNDVRPQNIIISRDATTTPSFKLVDFGSATCSPVPPNWHIETAGRFMSPETMGNDVANAATDVYSLGLTVLASLTRFVPASSAGRVDVDAFIRMINTEVYGGDFVKLSPAMVETITAMLEHDPSVRISCSNIVQVAITHI